jgi:hypothetical protein
MPDVEPSQLAGRGFNLRLGNAHQKIAEPLDETRHLVRVFADLEQGVFGAQDAPDHFVGFADAAKDAVVGRTGVDAVDERGVALVERVADGVDLVVDGVEEPALVARVVEPEPSHILVGLGCEIEVVGHRARVAHLDGGAKPRLDELAVGGLLDHLDPADMGIHVRVDDDQVEVPVVIRVETAAVPEFGRGLAHKVRPEKLADRDLVRLPVLECGNNTRRFHLAIAHDVSPLGAF